MTNRKFVLTARASALALLIGIPAAPAFAAEDDATVEELVVTARKRDEALIDELKEALLMMSHSLSVELGWHPRQA